jgi:hypothetical protein
LETEGENMRLKAESAQVPALRAEVRAMMEKGRYSSGGCGVVASMTDARPDPNRELLTPSVNRPMVRGFEIHQSFDGGFRHVVLTDATDVGQARCALKFLATSTKAKNDAVDDEMKALERVQTQCGNQPGFVRFRGEVSRPRTPHPRSMLVWS